MDLEQRLGSVRYWRLRNNISFAITLGCMLAYFIITIGIFTQYYLLYIFAHIIVFIFFLLLIRKMPFTRKSASGSFNPWSININMNYLAQKVSRACKYIDKSYAENICVSILGSQDSSLKAESYTGIRLPLIGGIGRILISRKFIEENSVSHIASMCSHEIGHANNHDVLKKVILVALSASVALHAILISILSLIYMLGIISIFQENIIISTYEIIGVLFWSLFMITIGSQYLFVLLNWTYRQQEFAADAYGAMLVGPSLLIELYVKLGNTEMDSLFAKRIPLQLFLNVSRKSDHPPLVDRIRVLQNFVPK